MPSWSSGTENGFWNKGGGMITFQAQPKDKEHSEEQKSR